MTHIEEAAKLRRKYTHFRVLVIGRANAGKTTLLKRVCNTTDEPCIFDEKNNNLLEPTSERGIHDIHRPFAFASNPQFIFHDSPGFEAGGEEELLAVQSFIEKRARSTEVKNQLHAIWFCLVTDNARPLLALEERFFNEKRAGNVPLIAIFTKLDDLITQVYDMDKEEDENREFALGLLEEKFRKPLCKYKFPPQANVCFEAIHEDKGDHQDQVKALISQTAGALNDLALQMLFVSVQQNNLDLCIKYAIEHSPLFARDNASECSVEKLAEQCLLWFKHSYYASYDYGSTERDDFAEGEEGEGFRDEGQDFERLDVERAQVEEEFERLEKNAHSVATQMNNTFPNSSLFALTAMLISLKFSFWPTSQSSVFKNAFQQAFQSYTKHSMKNEVERKISNLGLYPANNAQQQRFKSALLQITLHHSLTP